MAAPAGAADPVRAAVLAAGDAIAPFALKDQNDKPVVVHASVTLLLSGSDCVGACMRRLYALRFVARVRLRP